ncbi:MAG TPA: NADH-quinone oxidoreductase subunit M, partial [Candidatus Wallbacteria bacterium]|nr:NADH-quinone oxidoreductase subunit M [Candidatus Wallbacteria bacterium]
NLKYYISLYFLLEFTMLGALVATDMVLFYMFWELMLIPMYLIIGCWGGPNRIHAAVKFFLYTVFGSVFMLWAIFWVVSYHQGINGVITFDISELSKLVIDPVSQRILFCFFSIAFMIKVPLFPFHTWLAHAHVEAPTGGSVILAAVLLKMGTYGFLRFSIPMFPGAAAEFAPYMMFLGAFGVFYGACMSYAQTDLKKLIAYSSVSHLGAITAGIFALNAQGVSGSIIQMINHGISTGALFILAGVIYERRHSRELSEFGGLAKCMPLYSTLFAIAAFSSIGLPGLNGFIGEFLILLGAFGSSWALGFLTATGIIMGAVYMLMVYERMFLGKINKAENERLPDLSFSEKFGLAPLIVLMFAIGIYPSFITNKIEKSVVSISAPFSKKITAGSRLDLSRYICQKKY